MSEHAIQLAVLLVEEMLGELPSHGLAVLIQQHLVLWHDPEYTGRAFYEADISNAYALARAGTYPELLKGRLRKDDRLRGVACDLISDIVLLGHVRVGDLTQTYFPKSGEHGTLDEVILSDRRVVQENGAHNVNDIHSCISDLLISGFLRPVHESHVRPAADNAVEAEQVVPRDTSYRLKTEVQGAWEQSVKNKLEEWRYGSKAETEFLPRPHKGTKRVLEDDKETAQNKKVKPTEPQSYEASSVNASPSGWLDDDLTLRINHEKFAIVLRNQQLAALVDESISPITATVYADLLRIADTQFTKCKDDFDDLHEDGEINLQLFPKVPTHELEHLLLNLPDLCNSLGSAAPGKIDLRHFDHPRKKMNPQDPLASEIGEEESENESMSGMVSEEANESEDLSVNGHTGTSVSSDSEPGEPDGERTSGRKRRYKTPDTTPDNTPKTNGVKSRDHPIRQHLLLLAEQPDRFLIHIPRTSKDPERWAIPYPDLSKLLFQNALLSITTSRFGPLAGRLLRILCTQGENKTANPKLDEKMLVLLSLIPQKKMRTILHNMHRAGHIELQEVPKDSNQRRPGSTMFFWFFDPERCRARMLEECYKTMGNLVRRARVERERVRGVVEKSERTDVVGREEEFLGEGELKALKEWKEREERIWGEVGRLDTLVAVIRDF
ncbi:MAG: hypothetical protein Q9228_003745 [Teloschistes exilis]